MALGTAFIASPAAAAEPVPRFNPPKRYYLALGDSIPFGFQASKFAAGLPPSAFDTGYVDVFAARLRTVKPGLTVVNFGCPGESTASFIDGPCPYTAAGNPLHHGFEGSQLNAAVVFLQAHPGQVSPITLDLWGNDINEFIQSCAGDFQCILATAPSAIAQFGSRLRLVLHRLRVAAPAAEIIINGAYNPNVGFFPETDPLFQALNVAISSAAAEEQAHFADVFSIFNPQGDLAVETAAICTLTLLCTEGDSHPSDAGYRAIADAAFEASGYGRLGA